MAKIFQRLILAFVVLAVVSVASCSLQASNRTRAIEHVAVGESEQSVIALLGNPSRQELPGHPYLLYASQGCIAPCTTRMWWEWPLFRGIEAWSVELDSSHKVLSSYHWVSP